MFFRNVIFVVSFYEPQKASFLFFAAPLHEPAVQGVFISTQTDPQIEGVSQKHDIVTGPNDMVQHAKKIDGISGEAMEMLIAYRWPGNVRELENAVEHAVVVCKTSEIIPANLPGTVKNGIPAPGAGGNTVPGSLEESEKNHIARILRQNGWNISQSAKELGIDRATLYSKIKKYQIKK